MENEINFGNDDLNQYFELAMAELTDDVSCDSWSIAERNGRMEGITRVIGEQVADALDTIAHFIATQNGFMASGAPYKH